MDELYEQILADELEDAHQLALTGQVKMSVIEYAKWRSKKTGELVQAQLIYYYIRTGKIKQENCICGRKVIDVKSADTFFAHQEAKRRAKQ